MKRQKRTIVLDVIIAATGWFFLFMALAGLKEDEFGLRIGLVFGLSLTALYIWRKIREIRRKSVRTGAVNIALFIGGLFFLAMGVTDIGHEPFGVKLGFGLAIPLFLCYFWRKLRDVKRADAGAEAAAQEPPLTAPVRAVPRPGTQAAQNRVTVCPHCGAPGKGDTCQYCGMPK